jgi:hypothetical protein
MKTINKNLISFLLFVIFILPLYSCIGDYKLNIAGEELVDDGNEGGEEGEEGETVTSILPVDIKRISRITGATPSGETYPNPNNTLANYGIASTDIGVMWDNGNGEVMMAFGDNFGENQTNWKSNAIAISSDRDLSDGLTFSRMIMDGNQVKEIIVSGKKQGQNESDPDFEITCIPTAGISVGNRQFINYMSVHEWALGGDNDSWSVNYSEIVYSDDNGENWTKSGVKWAANSNFAQVSYLKKDGKVYMFGTPSGRYGNVFLSRVNEANMLDKASYEYWNGTSWDTDESAAAAVTFGSTAEMSVTYNSYYDRYFMMYLSVGRRAIVYRDAEDVIGEWSAEKILMKEDGNALYAPYFHPWFNDSKEMYYVISHASPIWNMFLVHAGLEEDPNGFNMLSEGGFEEYTDKEISFRSPWWLPDSEATGDAKSGNVACKLENGQDGAFKDAVLQTVAVKRNTDYILTGWAKGSWDNITGTWFGVRKPDGNIQDYNPVINTNWTKMSIEFNSGNNSTVDVFCGLWGWPELFIIIDDIHLQPKAAE